MSQYILGYTELSLGDQVHLIECCWMELLLLNCAFRSMEHCGRRLVIAPDLILERFVFPTSIQLLKTNKRKVDVYLLFKGHHKR
jgi:hypothetical protein